MKMHPIQRAALDACLKLVRLPMDLAVAVLPDGGVGIRPAARAAVDGADSAMRAMLGLDPDPPVEREPPRHQPVQAAAQRRSERTRPVRRADNDASGGSASSASTRAPAARVRRQRKAVLVGAKQLGNDLADQGASRQPVPEPRRREPSEEEIATRAYELYERGVPGDAAAHWEIAKRELTTST